MEILDKNTIEKYILPNLSIGLRGKDCEPDFLLEIISAIIYRLKTGCQWRQLPVKQFFTKNILTWQGVYYHFNEWTKDGSWTKVWTSILSSNRQYLDLPCIQLDGSHTPSKRGGEAVGYQGRKSTKTTNMLYLADNQGQMLACASPQEGQHHDLFNVQELFEELCHMLTKANINIKGLFLNADSGFDSTELRQICKDKEIEANIDVNMRKSKTHENQSTEYQYFDEELYKRRTVIEHANAWMDSFKALLIRFETKAANWVALILLAFSVRFLLKIQMKTKS
ncbi:IS5 family transposase [Dyadobacter frigoris]|uniref:IS5 family transposase n=1 Tax=Dyadobacter frigoris TaxID=2576211 RepID=A0A4U6DAU0_9BACT|nr:IS5 family transposase [Dyadobacter frigoris]TKT91404.1 IS5 family transposase [Dyadobacter frigoris]